MGYLLPPFKLLPLSVNRRLENARKTIQDTALSMIRAKQAAEDDKQGRGERDILGVMIEENRNNLEMGALNDALNEMEMVNQIMTFLAAGFVPEKTANETRDYLVQCYLGIVFAIAISECSGTFEEGGVNVGFGRFAEFRSIGVVEVSA
jgi:hypothetical protein